MSRVLLVLGGGMEENGWPSAGTVLRAEKAAQYYGMYDGEVEQIVCCGSFSGSMEGRSAGETTEAEWIQDSSDQRAFQAVS